MSYKSVTIGVAVCTFNGEKFIREQLSSIAEQSIKPDHVHIFDDGSSDGTVRIAEEFCSRYPGWKLTVQSKNTGYRKNFETAILSLDDDIIFLSDQDDVWYPEKVKKTMSFFDSDREAFGVYTNADVIDGQGRRLDKTIFEHFQVSKRLRGENRVITKFFRNLLRRNIITGATFAFRKELIPLVIPFSPRLVHDHWIGLISLGCGYKIGVIERPLMAYRSHDFQQLGLGKKTAPLTEKEWLKEKKATMDEVLERIEDVAPNMAQKRLVILKEDYKADIRHSINLRHRYMIRRKKFFARVALTAAMLLSGRYTEICRFRRDGILTTIKYVTIYVLRDLFLPGKYAEKNLDD